MKFKCFVILGFFVAVESASVFLKPVNIPVNIPVKVIYGDNVHETPRSGLSGVRNLNEKIQISSNQIKQLKHLEDKEEHRGNVNSLKNLEAKVQLSPEELLLVDRHLPLIEGDKEDALDLKLNSVEDAETSSVENLNSNADGNEKPTESNKPSETVFGVLGEAPPEKEILAPSSTSVSPATTEESLPDPNMVLLIQLAQNIVMTGLTTIKENIDNLPAEEDNNSSTITSEQWDRLNRTISVFFGDLLNRVSSRANNENILNDIVRGVRSTTNDFIRNLNTPSAVTTHQVPGVSQNIINLLNSGVQRITDNINNIPTESTTKNTILGDSATTAPPQGPGQVFQNVVNQVGEAINNISPFSPDSTFAPGSQADESSPTLNPFQSVVNQVGQAINNFNPFNQPPTAAPGSQGDEQTTSNPLQQFQNAASQVGQIINNLNPFNQQSSTPASGSQGDSPTTSNPFQSFQNAANQVGQVINNIIRPTPAPGSASEETTGSNGPFQAVQNVFNQIGQTVNNFNPFNNQGSQQNEESTATPPPFQQAVQNVVNQVGEAINNFNPFNTPTNAPPQSEGTESPGNNPIEGIQNAINQAGQTISNLNPLNQSSGSSSPVEGVQNAINQAGQTISSLNPANQGSGGSNPVEGIQNAINQVGQGINNLNPVNQGPSSNPIEGVQGAINQAGQTISNLNPANQGSNPLEGIQSAINQAGQSASNLNPLNQGSGGSNPIEGIQNVINQAGQAVSQGASDSPPAEAGSLQTLPVIKGRRFLLKEMDVK